MDSMEALLGDVQIISWAQHICVSQIVCCFHIEKYPLNT